MNGAASVYTSSSDNGTSNGLGNGLSPKLARIYDECLDSTVKMEPAAVKYAALMMSAAAPKYALTPTPSRMDATATKLLGSVTGKLYLQAATGVAPALVRAAVRKLTWVVSSEETVLRLP